jgi:hypothetical protein
VASAEPGEIGTEAGGLTRRPIFVGRNIVDRPLATYCVEKRLNVQPFSRSQDEPGTELAAA